MTGLAFGLGAASPGTTAHAGTGTTALTTARTGQTAQVTATKKAATKKAATKKAATKKKKKLTRKQRNKAIARKMVSQRGWSGQQYRCLVSLWTRESNWNHRAYNRRTGAGGIPQALPASKMGSAGRDWRTNPKTQIKWGLRYIKGRYGTPCGAWAHFRSRNWY